MTIELQNIQISLITQFWLSLFYRTGTIFTTTNLVNLIEASHHLCAIIQDVNFNFLKIINQLNIKIKRKNKDTLCFQHISQQ